MRFHQVISAVMIAAAMLCPLGEIVHAGYGGHCSHLAPSLEGRQHDHDTPSGAAHDPDHAHHCQSRLGGHDHDQQAPTHEGIPADGHNCFCHGAVLQIAVRSMSDQRLTNDVCRPLYLLNKAPLASLTDHAAHWTSLCGGPHFPPLLSGCELRAWINSLTL